jgi:hypothetical protein
MLLFFKQIWSLLIILFITSYSAVLSANTYANMSYPFSWVNATSHTKLGPVTGGIYSSSYKFTNSGGCGTRPPNIDDTISDLIPIGFTFRYGDINFTSVRVMTNGRLQFNNNTCGSGSPVTQLPYPISSLNYSMRIYGNDMDPTLKSEVSGYTTNCTSRTSCYVSYGADGSSPNRRFIVTWSNVPEWAATNAATGSYNLQIILHENGEFVFQYGDSTAGPNARQGQIGWQVNVTDYAVAGTGFPVDNTAYLFYIPNSGSMRPGAFNAFDTATWGGSTTGIIQTKVAGTPFSLDVVALTSTPTVLTNFTGAVKVELVNGDSAASCASMTNIQTITSNYTFKATEKGRHTFSAITQADSFRNVQVRLSYPAASPTTVVCATDGFAIRPSYFTFVASDGNWSTAGTTRILNAASNSATPIHKAASPFTLKITPYNSLNVVTSNYDGSPDLSITCVLPESGCVMGGFNVGTFSAAGGIATSNTAQFDEVGAFNAIVSDSQYAAIDKADGTSVTDRTISSSSSTVGRFVPDRFDVSLNTPSFTPGCGTFSYVGQPLRYNTRPVVTVTAKNAAGAVTQNYKGSLWKIVSTGLTPSYAAASQALTVLNANVPSVIDNSNGTGTLSFADTTSNILAFSRADPLAPFSAEIAMSFTLQDTDGVTASSNPVSFGAASAGNGIAFSGGNKSMRWGRLVMQNAYGSELMPLDLPLFSEYFNGSSFVGNTADLCTSLTLSSQLSLSNPVTASGVAQPGNSVMTIGSGSSRATLANSPLLAGAAGLSFSAPGSGNTGYIDISGNFSALPWLLFDWDHDGSHDDSASARVSFGVYQGNNRQIYWREVY